MKQVPSVELIHVTKRFGEVVAVDDLSLKIEDREFFSLLGSSGCGKNHDIAIDRRIGEAGQR